MTELALIYVDQIALGQIELRDSQTDRHRHGAAVHRQPAAIDIAQGVEYDDFVAGFQAERPGDIGARAHSAEAQAPVLDLEAARRYCFGKTLDAIERRRHGA